MNDQITTLLPEAEPATGVDCDWAVENFYEALYKFAFGLAGSESDAADLTQDTYRVLLTKGDAIRDSRKVKSWLFTTLYRQFLGRRRHATRFPETPVESAEWELPTITPQHAEALDGSLVVAALQQLDEKYRAPLAMFYLEELSYEEMAEVLGFPIGTIMSRMSRGKEILRKRLQPLSAAATSARRRDGRAAWVPPSRDPFVRQWNIHVARSFPSREHDQTTHQPGIVRFRAGLCNHRISSHCRRIRQDPHAVHSRVDDFRQRRAGKLPRTERHPQDLNAVEQTILRVNYAEPRLHFVLVCAAKGCPLQRNVAYVGAQLGEQLVDQAKQFLAESTKNRIATSERILYLSPIFEGYGSEFEKKSGSVLTALRSYWPGKSVAGYQRFKIRYTDYDWSLNEQGK